MKKPTKGARQLLGASAAFTLAGTVSLVGAPSAGAAGDYLQVSPDGSRYGSTLPGPVFNASVDYVPGAGQNATIWVRNNSAESARLSSAAVVIRSDPELNGYLGLATASGSDAASRTALGMQGSCSDLPATWNLGSGEAVALTFEVDLALDAPNATRNREAEFDLLFYLEPTSAGLAPRAACGLLDDGDNGGGDNGDGGGGGGNGSDDAGTGTGTPVTGEATVVAVDAGTGARSTALQAPAAAAGELVVLPGSGTPGGGPQAVAVGAVAEQPAGVPANRTPLEQEPPLLDAMVQSTVEPVIRSLSGTLLIAMSVAFAAAVVLRVWSRRYE